MGKYKYFVLFILAVLSLTGCGNQTITVPKGGNLTADDVKEEVDDLEEAEFKNTSALEGASMMESAESAPIIDKVENIIRSDIIDVDTINKLGGIIEFAGEMSYKEFLELNWVSDVDNTLSEDAGVYIVKIYYPDGFEHYKMGLIENCEAIGIYRAGDGEYLGGSFQQRTPGQE